MSVAWFSMLQEGVAKKHEDEGDHQADPDAGQGVGQQAALPAGDRGFRLVTCTTGSAVSNLRVTLGSVSPAGAASGGPALRAGWAGWEASGTVTGAAALRHQHRREDLGHLRRRLGAVGRRLCHQAADQPGDAARDLGPERLDGRRVFQVVLEQLLHRLRGGERHLPGQQVVEGAAEAVEVGADVDGVRVGACSGAM